jgi:hypothetical protein
MAERIVAVVDLSGAERTIAAAAELARPGSEVVALALVEYEYLGYRGGFVPLADPDEAAAAARRAVAALERRGVRSRAAVRLVSWLGPAREVAAAASEVDAAVIVADRQTFTVGGSRRAERGIRSLIRHAPCPVALTGDRTHYTDRARRSSGEVCAA